MPRQTYGHVWGFEKLLTDVFAGGSLGKSDNVLVNSTKNRQIIRHLLHRRMNHTSLPQPTSNIGISTRQNPVNFHRVAIPEQASSIK